MGCHAPERPTLGLTVLGEETTSVAPAPVRIDRPPLSLAPRPCSGDAPGPPGRVAPLRWLACPTFAGPEAATSAPLDVSEPSPLLPRRLVSRLDRPPRRPLLLG